MRLIIGLGNPGEKYRDTRHNIGFQVLEAFAEKRGLSFRLSSSMQGEIASGENLLLLRPTTYMNLSGHAVRKVMDYYKISPPEILVVTDDIYVPFGRFRLRKEGSAGGHNGLKSIEESLGTKEYPRLRVGIGQDLEVELSCYVLSSYRKEEKELLPRLLSEAVEILERILELGIEQTLQYANSLEIK